MGTIMPGRLCTPDDLLRMPDAVAYELVGGRLVERWLCIESSVVAVNVLFLLGDFLRGRRLGHLFDCGAGYQCFARGPDTVRKPDASFVRSGRFPGGRVPEGHSPAAPDLAIEVTSPGEPVKVLEEKVANCLSAGVPLVWIVNPQTRSVQVRRPRTSPLEPVSQLTDADTISGEAVLPGFSGSVKGLF